MRKQADFQASFACYSRLHDAPDRGRLGTTTWLAATVAVLLPALAWLQYDWVNQIAAADRDRSRRTLRAAASQFTSAVDARAGARERAACSSTAPWSSGATGTPMRCATKAPWPMRPRPRWSKQIWFVEARGGAASADERLVAHGGTPPGAASTSRRGRASSRPFAGNCRRSWRVPGTRRWDGANAWPPPLRSATSARSWRRWCA